MPRCDVERDRETPSVNGGQKARFFGGKNLIQAFQSSFAANRSV
ncbi:MAG: hypothetical protein V7642_5285 [Burkholderiales bacterium]|jgi:hypothetical protein